MNLAVLEATGMDAATKTLIQGAFDSLQATGIEIFGMVVVASVAVVVVVSGGKFAIKWLKGILSKAG